MLINFPNQLTSEEEQLLKKIAKMKKKKKLFSEKKSSKDSQAESQATNASNSVAGAVKRSISVTQPGKQLDAKEAAKKLIQSGAIKFETENKEKGFKRSCSRKDDSRPKPNLNINPETNEPNKQVSYSSVASPSSAQSPPLPANSPFYNAGKFSFNQSGDQQQQQQGNQYQRNFRKNTFQYNQTPNSSSDQSSGYQQSRFHNNHSYNYQKQQQQGISLYIKANNVTEDLLRSLFNANVSQAKILSIDVKTNFAFVSVDSKESADNAIQELNGKTFQDSLFSVSLARPKKVFNRNNSLSVNRPNYFNQNYNQNNNNQNQANSSNLITSPNKTNINSNTPSTTTNDPTTNASRQLINYEDVQ